MRSETVDTLLTAPIVAKMLGTSTRSVRHMVRDRQLKPLRLPHVRGFRFQRSAVQQLIDSAVDTSGAHKCALGA
ncbi:helix-turn-helix transcriptional regulator [Terriglobus aquaticus]|uniref:Helix-turn-helix transcriptional regulator n=1 Tax=Terriglobus aquaticus TaxID=940139 RepID=A0ABW9KIA1_9BACT|nr:helix-turn-helix domain-containing protein [Terriglobus aquaticus]